MLNPIVFTERVVRDFLRYQITTYPFADPGLHGQLRNLLNLDHSRRSPLLKGPYVSLNRPFRPGPPVAQLVNEGILHPLLPNIAPHPSLYGHQESAIRAIVAGRTTLISTGTGSGKTECFLYPIVSRCLRLRDEHAAPGIVAVLVYPMNALAEDQLERLRAMLVGTGVSFGMYIGKTPERSADVTGKRLGPGTSRAGFEAGLRQRERDRERSRNEGNYAIHPPEERCSREEMRAPGGQPRILLTNIKQLELLLTRQRDVELFDGARLEFIVFDEAHTFKGAQGAETACLIRRLRSYCGRSFDQVTCVAASATIVSGNGGEGPGREFASRFFGVAESAVDVVTEQYVDEDWAPERALPEPLAIQPSVALARVLQALGSDDDAALVASIAETTGLHVPAEGCAEALHGLLARNELLFRIVSRLRQPLPLDSLRDELANELGRALSEEEILLWLALGAAARQDDRPLVRPVLHGFIRGVGGAVVTFPAMETLPRLWLSAEDSRAIDEGGEPHFPLPVKTCTTCGQHYFTHAVAGFDFTGDAPGGGERVGENTIWRPLSKKDGGIQITLFDRLVSEEDEELHERAAYIHFCRHCGIVHASPADSCAGCGRTSPLVRLQVVRQNQRNPHYLTSCLACGARGGDRPGTYREPARPVRATTVSDVHVLAQNMLLHGDQERLLVFADNRQDAAFQAGWMRDHARRFRIRSLMLERLNQGAVTVGDLAAWLEDRLDNDRPLSESVLPEVWRLYRPDSEPIRHAEERRLLIRILVLREVTTGVRQRIGLEPWGRMRVDYAGLSADLPFFQRWAPIAGISPAELLDGVANLIDTERRKMVVWDSRGRLFSKFWNDGEAEVVRGYLPQLPGVPKGLKLFREPSDDENRIAQWWSQRGATVARKVAQQWGVPHDQLFAFLEDLWRLLRHDLNLLAEVQLRRGGRNGSVFPNTRGSCQFDAERFLLVPQQALWECDTCRRLHARPAPRMGCMGYRCHGTLVPKQEDPDNYDLAIVTRQVGTDLRMLKPREHSAQVPFQERETLERMFKDPENTRINTLVCTPTLELGVDIGSLDSILMRNVPPLPANYWQRAGRAGRRHRLAVSLTYARTASHDREYFSEPLRLLNGAVAPPRLNLRNPEMVRKHAHAVLLSALQRLAKEGGPLPESERVVVAGVIDACFPKQISSYLFDEHGNIRTQPRAVGSLERILQPRRAELLDGLRNALQTTWPAADADAVADDALGRIIDAMPNGLAEVVQRLWRRLQWALRQKARLAGIEAQRGTLNDEERAIRLRCDRLISRYKGEQRTERREAEGVDDTNTFAVLAAEGFLPGYGLDRGSVLGAAIMPRGLPGPAEYLLPRAQTLALREYVPGNLIYANGHRFVPRIYHLEATDPVTVRVNLANEAVAAADQGTETVETGGTDTFQVLPICDVDLPHHWHIHDEEDHRFQLAVVILGHELGRHGEGSAYRWGQTDVIFRRGVHLRLVNVGVSLLIRSADPVLGYPVCAITGQSRSPLASDRELEDFRTSHRERYGREPRNVGFYADVVADELLLRDCANASTAYSTAEVLRLAAAELLDMEIEDLQVLCVPHLDRQTVDAVLFDPMPGGSGLLEQLTTRWPEVVERARALLANCSRNCSSACIDCLMHFRNAHYHHHLNRHVAARLFEESGTALEISHPVPAALPRGSFTGDGEPAHAPEMRLRDMFRQASFPEPEAQRSIAIGHPWGATIPDFFFPDPTERTDGVCVYLDGLSDRLHGNPETRERDEQMRERLREMGCEVVAIPATALDDPERVAAMLSRIARILMGKAEAERLRSTWRPSQT